MAAGDLARVSRLGYLAAIALAASGFVLVLAAWWAGESPQWTSLALPILIVVNGVAALGLGPFRNIAVRRRYTYVSIAAALVILVVLLQRISMHGR
jgi:hypothetical protein